MIKKISGILVFSLLACWSLFAQSSQKELLLPVFTKITIDGPYQVNLIQSTQTSVNIEGDDNSIRNMVCIVKGGELQISAKKKIDTSTLQHLIINIGVVELKALEAEEGAKVSLSHFFGVSNVKFIVKDKASFVFNDFSCNTMRLTCASGAKVDLTKYAVQRLTLQSKGNVSLNMTDVNIVRGTIKLNGQSQMKIQGKSKSIHFYLKDDSSLQALGLNFEEASFSLDPSVKRFDVRRSEELK